VRGAGELLVGKLHELIHKGASVSEVIPTRLVVRQSSGAPG